MSAPQSPSRKGFFGIGGVKKSGDGTTTPSGEMTSIAQTPIMESSNPLDKVKIPTEARNQQIVGQTGEAVHEDTSKLLLAIDGTEAGDKAFKYLMESKVISKDAHIFIVSVLPSSMGTSPWVSGPLSIDMKQQDAMLKALRESALNKLQPYKDSLREKGFNVTLHTLHGSPRESILRVSNHHKVDMIVCGKRNAGWKRGLSSGTTSSHLVAHSSVPVLVIK